jgi:hypothetical protein
MNRKAFKSRQPGLLGKRRSFGRRVDPSAAANAQANPKSLFLERVIYGMNELHAFVTRLANSVQRLFALR